MELELGQKIPEWSLEPILTNDTPTVESYFGKPLLVLIFSLDCPGCVGRAIPFANRMVFENGEKMHVIGIHTNAVQCEITDSQFQEAKNDLYIRFPFFKDHRNKTYLNYGAGGTPHWILTDEKGRVVYSIFGSDPNNALLRIDYKIKEVFQ
jgi:peroxiredoxin